MDIDSLLSQLGSLGALRTHVGVLAGAIFMIVRAWRLPIVQGFIPEQYRWNACPLL